MTLFTVQEKRAILFLIGSLVLGYGIKLYNQSHYYDGFTALTKKEKESFKQTAELAYSSIGKSSEKETKVLKGGSSEKDYTPETEIININTAQKQDLIKLPKIGEVTAERIIRFRDDYGPFKTFDDLMKVKGIGPKTLAKLKSQITL